MAEPTTPVRFLLTNDDGIDAPGLSALEHAARPLGETAWVAPAEELSGCGHRVTTHRPMRVHRRGERRWALEGTPADCVRVALHHLAIEPDWVLSGLNQGGNLGADVYISGTVAAVREAALHGKSGIAFSHYKKREMEIDWKRAATWMTRVMKELLTHPNEPGTLWNVNLPHLGPDAPEPQIVHCDYHRGPLPVRFRETDAGLLYAGNYHERPRLAGCDIDVCFSGGIAVSKLVW